MFWILRAVALSMTALFDFFGLLRLADARTRNDGNSNNLPLIRRLLRIFANVCNGRFMLQFRL